MMPDTQPLPSQGREATSPGSARARRYLGRARVLVAANLGAVLGYLLWLGLRKDAREAAVLTLAEYTARFETYRSQQLEGGKLSMLFCVLLGAFLALAAAGVYELLSRGLAALMARTRLGSAIAPWGNERGPGGAV